MHSVKNISVKNIKNILLLVFLFVLVSLLAVRDKAGVVRADTPGGGGGDAGGGGGDAGGGGGDAGGGGAGAGSGDCGNSCDGCF